MDSHNSVVGRCVLDGLLRNLKETPDMFSAEVFEFFFGMTIGGLLFGLGAIGMYLRARRLPKG
jgi:hypothetical protein